MDNIVRETKISECLTILGYTYKYCPNTGFSYQVDNTAWVHFNPFTRNADATLLMVHSRIDLVWLMDCAAATVGKHHKVAKDWREAVIDVFILNNGA